MKERKLRWRIVTILLVVSLVPLCLMGAGAWVVFGRLLEGKALELHRTVVEKHAQAIESYLSGRVRLLQLLAGTHSLERIADHARLESLFSELDRAASGGFVDLGVIDAEGRHRAYVGPYQLMDRNYREADWFREVMAEGVHVSDVFPGFRQVPHCIIAVRAADGTLPWILRATIDSNQFDGLVRTGVLGETGDAFILNREGIYQTAPRVGAVLDKCPLPPIGEHRGALYRPTIVDGVGKVQTTTWLNDRRWVLVVQQDRSEIRAPVTRAMTSGALVVCLSVALVVVTTFIATWHLTNRIDRANADREGMFRAFMRSARLASVGELATGLAHEINNPLAIITAEDTNIGDLIRDPGDGAEAREEMLESVERIHQQVRRCASITQKMLQFGRKGECTLELAELSPRLREILDLMRRQAKVRNVEMILEVEESLPEVMVDRLELEQVLVNLINNSLHALPRGGEIRIQARRVDREVHLEVRDNGEGIPPGIMDRIFEPFFTTKPVGQGTGLGLSACYGMVHSWGGTIEAESEAGQGTTMRIRFPRPQSKGSRT